MSEKHEEYEDYEFTPLKNVAIVVSEFFRELIEAGISNEDAARIVALYMAEIGRPGNE